MSPLVIEREINATAGAVWAAWTSQPQKWWGPGSFARAWTGGGFRFEKRFEAETRAILGEFLELAPGERLRATFFWENNPETVSEFSVELKAKEQKTLMTLTHVPKTGVNYCESGWTGAIDALEKALENKAFNYDWTRFTKRIFIAASPDTLYAAWAVPDQITRWFVTGAKNSRAGQELSSLAGLQPRDRYEWSWPTCDTENGEILEADPGKRFAFTFGAINGRPVEVSVDFIAHGKLTAVEIRQEHMVDTPTAQVNWHLSCQLGWAFFLTNLKAFVEHGVDLREKSRELTLSGVANI